MTRLPILAAIVLATTGCDTTMAHETITARVTYYSREECGGRKTACGGRPVEGVTVAVDPRLIAYGRTVEIPALRGIVGDGSFVATDTGRAVKSRKAAKAAGRGDCPVVDVFLASRERVREVTGKLGKAGHFLTVEVR